MKPVILAILVPALFLSGCGDEGGNDSLTGRELVQDIKLTNYHIDHAEGSVNVFYRSGTKQTSRTELAFAPTEIGDRISRVLEGDHFVLAVNDKVAGVDVGPDGRIHYEGVLDESQTGCQSRGRTQVKGQADHRGLDLIFEMDLELNGEGCTDLLVASYNQYRDQEIDRLNLQVIRTLLTTLNQDLSQAQRIEVRSHLKGDLFLP